MLQLHKIKTRKLPLYQLKVFLYPLCFTSITPQPAINNNHNSRDPPVPPILQLGHNTTEGMYQNMKLHKRRKNPFLKRRIKGLKKHNITQKKIKP